MARACTRVYVCVRLKYWFYIRSIHWNSLNLDKILREFQVLQVFFPDSGYPRCARNPIRKDGDAKAAGQSRIFLNRLCIVTPPTTNAAVTSQALTNLVFLVRRKDQPLDKSVFIRKEEKPSSIYQPCSGHYSLSFSPKPAFLSPNIRHPSWLVSLIVLLEHQSSNFTPNRYYGD